MGACLTTTLNRNRPVAPGNDWRISLLLQDGRTWPGCRMALMRAVNPMPRDCISNRAREVRMICIPSIGLLFQDCFYPGNRENGHSTGYESGAFLRKPAGFFSQTDRHARACRRQRDRRHRLLAAGAGLASPAGGNDAPADRPTARRNVRRFGPAVRRTIAGTGARLVARSGSDPGPG